MKRVFPVCALALVLANPVISAADETITSVLDVLIEDASLAVEPDGVHRLRFRLVNDSPSNITLIGVRSENAAQGELIYHSHHDASEPIEALFLKPDEEADFSTSHLQARLVGLSITNSSVPFTLIFRNGEISGEAHVH